MMYAKIIFIRRDGTDGTYYPLTSRTCLFGRHQECDIPIKLREVADNHCQINVNEDGEILLTNLTGNSSSVSLNGSPVSNTVPLRHGDVFCIRERSFRFEVQSPLQKNMSAISGAISQINSSGGSHHSEGTHQSEGTHHSEGTPWPLVMENTEHRNIETQGNSVNVIDGNNVETGSSSTVLRRLNSSGLQMFHLQRIGPSATKPGVADVMDFWKVTSLIGRKATQIDFLIDSSDYVQGAYVSRHHARMVRRQNNIHRLFDDSLNGVFVNNFKIAGHVDLQVGDRVTFGHPQGSKLAAGTRVHQPDSEYQFMFEICSCPPDSMPPHQQEHNSKPLLQENNVARVPSSFRVPSEVCVPKTKMAKRCRNATRTFTQEDIATCQSQNAGTSMKVEMNEDISDQKHNSMFEYADKMQTEPVKKDDSLETGHDVGRNEVHHTGFSCSRTEVERMAVGEVEHNRISFQAILGHQQEEAGLETGPSGSGLGSNEKQQAVHTGSVTCVSTMKGNSVRVIDRETVPNRAVLNEKKTGIGKQEEFIAEDLSEPGLEARICGGQLAGNTGSRTEVNDSDVDMEAVDGEEVVQNECPRDHQNLCEDDMEEDQAENLFDFNDISIEQHQDTLISSEQFEPEQSADVLDNSVNVEQIFKCTGKSLSEIEKKESSSTMVDLSMPEPDLDEEFNEIVMKVKTELLAVCSQADGTNDAELVGGDETNSAQDKIYFVDGQAENIQSISFNPNVNSNGSMGIMSAGDSGAINTKAVDRTEDPGLGHKVDLSMMMDMEVSDPVSQSTEDRHPSSVNSLDNKNYGKEEVFETGSVLIVEKISVKDSRQPYVDENGKGSSLNSVGYQPIKSDEQGQLIQETGSQELDNATIQQNAESVDIKEKVDGLMNIVLKSVENVELKNMTVEKSDMASGDEGTNGIAVSHNYDIVDNSHLIKDIASIQQQSVSGIAAEMYQNVAIHEKESNMEISDPGEQLNQVVVTAKGSDNNGEVVEEDFIFGEKEFTKEVSYSEGIKGQEVASSKMDFSTDVSEVEDDIDKTIACFEEDFAKEASNTGQHDDGITMSDRSLPEILVGEKATDQGDTSCKLNVLSHLEDKLTSVLSDSRMETELAVSLSQKESFEDISNSREDNFNDIASFEDPSSEVMSNPEEKMEPGHVSIGNNELKFLSNLDEKSTTVLSDPGMERNHTVFLCEKDFFEDISNPKGDKLKHVVLFEEESSEVMSNPEEKMEPGHVSIENNELEVLSNLDEKSTTVLSDQGMERNHTVSLCEEESFEDISTTEGDRLKDKASFEKESSEVISNPEEKMEQGQVSVENNELEVLSDLDKKSSTVLSVQGKERDKEISSFEKESCEEISDPEEDSFIPVASFEKESSEVISDPEEKMGQGLVSMENNELEVLSDTRQKSDTVLSDPGKERDHAVTSFEKESFQDISNPEEDNFRDVALVEEESSEVMSNPEEKMEPEHLSIENDELEVLSNLDEKSTTVLSDQGMERNHTVYLCEEESFEDISTAEGDRLKDIASFEKESSEVISNPEEKMEQGLVSMENNELEVLSDTRQKSDTVLSDPGKERDHAVTSFEKESFQDISNPEEDNFRDVALFEEESSEVMSHPEEKMEPVHLSIENNELAVLSDLDKKSDTVLSVQGKERDMEISSFEKESCEDISDPEEDSFIPVASFEKESSEVISDPEEKMGQGLVSMENNELEVLSDTRQKSDTVLSDPGKERDHAVTSFEKESFQDISNPEEDNFRDVALVEEESSEVMSNPEEKMEPEHLSIENDELEVLSNLDEKSTTVLSDQGMERNHTVYLCEEESFEDISTAEGDRLKDIASFEKESSEVISNPEEKMEQGLVSMENNELEVLSDTRQKSDTVLSDPGKERDHAVTSFEKESFQDISNPEEDNFRDVALFEEESSEVMSHPEEKMEPVHLSIENNELAVLSDLDKKSDTVLSVQGKERDMEISSFEKESCEDISDPEEDSFIPVASFEKESSEVISDPEEKMGQGLVSMENNELEVLSDTRQKSDAALSDPGKERDHSLTSFEKESFQDISNPEEDHFKDVALVEEESSEVMSNPEEKMEPEHLSIENDELEVLSDTRQKSITVLSDLGKERDHAVTLFERKSFQDVSNPEEDNFSNVASFEEKFSESVLNPEEKMKHGNVSMENNKLEFLPDLDEKSTTVLSDQEKESNHTLSLCEKESFEDISKAEGVRFKDTVVLENESLEVISNPEEKMEPGHMSIENNELEVLSNLDEKSTTVLSVLGKERDQGIPLFQKESFEIITIPVEDNFRDVASFEDSSSEVISNPEEKMDPGHVSMENNELEVLSDLDKKSDTVLSVQGKERDNAVTSFEKKSFQDILNPEEDNFSDIASFEEKSLESVSNPEEKMKHRHVSMENNELEFLSDLDEKCTTVLSVQGKERDQGIPSFEKESFEGISNPEEDSLKPIASFEKESSKVISNSEEKMEPGHMSIENNELEVLLDLDEKSATVLSDPGKERDHAVTLFEKESFQDISNPEEENFRKAASFEEKSSGIISNPEEKMEQSYVSVEKNELEFLSDLDEKSAKEESSDAGLLNDKSSDAGKKCSSSLSYDKTDEIYTAVSQDEARKSQSVSQLETKHQMEISEDDHSFLDQSNTGDVREGTFQQGCSQDLFENSSQWNVSRIGCTDMTYGIASADLKSIENVESVGKSSKKRKLTEIFQENYAADDDNNGHVPTGVPLKKRLLPTENEHSGKSCSKDEVIKDESVVHMDWYEMESLLEHKTIDTKVCVENDTGDSSGCATSSIQNTDSGKQQFLPENDREIENNHIRKYFPGEDQSTLPIDCGGKTSGFKDNDADNNGATCIVDTVDDSGSSMNLTSKTNSNEQQCLSDYRLETDEELAYGSRISSKEMSDTEDHERAQDFTCNDGDCNVEPPTEVFKILSSTGEFQIIDMKGLSSREFKADSVAVMSDEDAESSELASVKCVKLSEHVRDKNAESSELADVKGVKVSELVIDKDAQSSEPASDRDAESSELYCGKGARSSALVGDEDVESSELVSDKDAESLELDRVKGVRSSGLVEDEDVESSELVSDKDAESSELVSDENVKSELVLDNDVESLELVMDKDAESSELVMDKDAELSELVMDKDAGSSELVSDKDAESSVLVMDKDAESSELVMDKDAELSEHVMDEDTESSELVMDKDDELSEHMDKDTESSELVSDKDAESSELVMDKDAESSELVMDKTAESSELVMDKTAESSELIIDKTAGSSERVSDNDAESSECVSNKNAESSELKNKDAESSELVMGKNVDSSELVSDKDAESSELLHDKDDESSEIVIDNDAELSELVMDKDAESSEYGSDNDIESLELVIDNNAGSPELVMDKDVESSELVMDKDHESSELVMDKDAEPSELVMDKDAEPSELVSEKDAILSVLVMDKDAESLELVRDKDVECSELVCDKDSALSEHFSGKNSFLSECVNSVSVENDLYMNDSCIKDNPESLYYLQDEETTSIIKPCDQSEGSSQRGDDLHTESAIRPGLHTANEKACKKRGCGEEITRDLDELPPVQPENKDKQGESMQLTDKSNVLNVKKMWQLSEKGKKSETKSIEFAPYIEGHGEELKPSSSPESEPLISLGSDDWDANSDVAMDTTENDTDSTLNDSTLKCLPFITTQVRSENVISVDQVKETSRCFVWSSNHLDDFSQQHAMSPVIPQQTSIFPKASTADQDELLFSDHSDDDDNGISSLKISALVDEIQETPIVDEAGILLEKTHNFGNNVVGSPLELKKEAISKSPRSDDTDHFNLDFSDIADDVIDDNDDVDERPVFDRYRDVKEDNVSNVNQSDEENVEDEEEHSSGNYGGNIEHVDVDDNENVDENFHGVISNDDNTDDVEEEEGHAVMLSRTERGFSSVKRKLKNNDNEYMSSPKKVRWPFIGSVDSPTGGKKLDRECQRHKESDSSTSFESHDQSKNLSYPDQSDRALLSLDSARSPSKYTSVRRQLEYKVKGKSRFQTIKDKLIHLTKDIKEESNTSSPLTSSSSSQETLGEMPPNSSQHNQFRPEGDHEKVTTLVTRCKSILEKFRQILNHQMDVLQTNRKQALIEELGTIEKWSELPKIVIAVVGNTGDGKSSLMNAMLGHSSILPTSGIRACTAVVVEIVQNSGSLYEGCIEFLTKEEWYSELERLIKDLTASDGNLRKNPPDPGSEQYVSYCKVKAVYGKIDKFDVLAGINKVTSHLGQKQNVKCKQAKKFRLEVERYIETQEPQSGGQFWPIVKRVQLRLPNCDVCRTGAVLVDLPGVRDSNAARDKIARDYLKTCSAIWVVSAIHRAIDDKTAQELLTENFRRQLLMDGQYGSVAFICTKSDQFENSEIIRTLKLQNKCKDHEQKISIMEKKKQRLLEEIKICRKRTHNLNAEIRTSIKECEDLQSLVQDIETQQMDSDKEQSVDYEPMEEAKVMVKEKEKEREKNEEAIQEITEYIDNYERQIQELETQIRQRRRKISHICASARNDYCREKIKQKFQSGLKEIKRQAKRLPGVDEDDDDDDNDDDEDAEEMNRMVNSLKVFCCSSTEYQKMKELIPADGEPTVFNSPEETEIPSLQEYVHELTRIRHEQYLERLIKGLGRCIFNFQSYLLDGGTECVETRNGVKSVIEKYLQDLNSMIQPVLQKMAEDLESTFNDMIQPKFHEGVGQAAQEATGICQKWGSKQSTDPANRRAGGLHWVTYKATIQRLGVYSSPTFGNIDFNEELSEPFYRTITLLWSRVFSSVLWKILETVQADILEKIQHFNRNVSSKLQKMGFPANRINHMKEQVESSVNYKLTEMVLHLKPLVTAKQRDISRILSPHVQSRLVEIYSATASHTGKGSFQRMKQEMESGIDARRMYIFDDGSQKMMHELLNLKTELVNTVKAVCDMLLEDIKLSFEPLWEDPSQSVLLRDTFQQHMEEVCEEMRAIYRDTSLQNTEEHVQSHKKSATTQHPPTLKRPQERKNVIEIVNMFISPVPEELTKMTQLEVLKVEKGSHMYPVKDVKQKPGLSLDSGMHNPSDVASSSGMDVTRIKMEVLSDNTAFLHHYKVEPPDPPSLTAVSTEDSVNHTFTSMAGPSNVYDFGEASVTKNSQHDQTHTKIKVRAKQMNNNKAHKNVPPEVRIALENHMVKRSTENSFKHGHAIVPTIAKQLTENSSRGSGGGMVSLLKPKPGTSATDKLKQLAVTSLSDSRQLSPAVRMTSSTMGTSSSVQARTSLIQTKGTTSGGTEGNSCDIKGTPSSDLKRTAPSVKTFTTASGIKTTLSDKMGISLPITEDDDSLPKISIAKRRKKTDKERNNSLYEDVQENPTCTHGAGKIPKKISTDTSLSTSSVSSRPRLLSNCETEATAISKTQNSKVTGSSKGPQRNKLRVEYSSDSSSSSEMLQITKQEPQEVDHLPHKQQSRHKQSPVIIDLTLSDDE